MVETMTASSSASVRLLYQVCTAAIWEDQHRALKLPLNTTLIAAHECNPLCQSWLAFFDDQNADVSPC